MTGSGRRPLPLRLDLKNIRVFCEVVREGSYSGAARSLGYSQPAVSQQMRSLERSLEVPLFVRLGRTMRLTEAGAALYEHSRGLLEGLAVAESRVRAVAGMETGLVRIAAFPSANATLIPALLRHMLEVAPGVSIELIEAEPPTAVQLLEEAACDVIVAFAYGAELQIDRELTRVPLLTDDMVVLRPRGEAREPRVLPITRFADDRWIAGCPQCSARFVEICDEAGFEPNIVYNTDDNLSIQSLVAANLGLSLIPELVVSFMRHPDTEVVRLDPAPRRFISAYTWARLDGIPAIRAVLEGLRHVARAQIETATASRAADT